MHKRYFYDFINSMLIADWDELDYIWSVYVEKKEIDLFMTHTLFGLFF